jgi:hypothetical protein
LSLPSPCVSRGDLSERVLCHRTRHLPAVRERNSQLSCLWCTRSDCRPGSIYGWGRCDGAERIISYSFWWNGAPKRVHDSRIRRQCFYATSGNVSASSLCFVNDKGPAGLGIGFFVIADNGGGDPFSGSFVSPHGYKPIGPVSIWCQIPPNNPATIILPPAAGDRLLVELTLQRRVTTLRSRCRGSLFRGGLFLPVRQSPL